MKDYKEEQKYITDQLEELADVMENAAKERLEKYGYTDPAIGVIYLDGRREFLYPKFNNDAERTEAMEKANQFIVESGGAGAVIAIDTHLHPVQGDITEALLVQQRSQNVKQFKAFTYKRTKDGDFGSWLKQLGPAEILRDTLITAFTDFD